MGNVEVEGFKSSTANEIGDHGFKLYKSQFNRDSKMYYFYNRVIGVGFC